MVSDPVQLSIAEQRKNLPIYKLKEELIKTINDNQITIIVGETGSGKSTQIVQYLAEAQYGLYGKICCTQPRCVAAVTLAQRVAEEFGCELGKDVGYSIRFSYMTCEETVIQYMTDGVLLKKCIKDPDFLEYSVIILDEAHERTVHTDILFALLKQVVKQRPDFKLIVTSATLDAGKFSEYFSGAPIFTIPGRTFPVEIFYPEITLENYFEASMTKVMDIHLKEAPGDILLFLPGEKEILKARKRLESKARRLSQDQGNLSILPIYSALPSSMQAMVFQPTPVGYRKVVVATNIAETSLTIDGISYVIDPGYAKNMTYNPKTGLSTLESIIISQAQANQRTGRAGRTGPGKCYRLYTEEDYQIKMLPTTIPVIKTTNLISEILQLKLIGFEDNLIKFDFMDPPEAMFITIALTELQSLLALDKDQKITKLGELMAEFPLIPNLSKCLIDSVELGCSDEMLTIVSLMSESSIFYRPLVNESYHKTFHLPNGDHLTLLKVYNEWKDNNYCSSWCYENKINGSNLERARKIREQLLRVMTRNELAILSCDGNTEKIEKAFCSGFFENVARREPSGWYTTRKGSKTVKIHASSSLCKMQVGLVVYKDIIKTSDITNIFNVVMCKLEWLDQFQNLRDNNLNNANQLSASSSSIGCESRVETSFSTDISNNADLDGGSQNMSKSLEMNTSETGIYNENRLESIGSKSIEEGIRMLHIDTDTSENGNSHIDNQNNHTDELHNGTIEKSKQSDLSDSTNSNHR